MAITFQRYNGSEWVTESEGGGGGISNHASLTNLAWSNAQHEIDTDFDMNGYNISDAGCLCLSTTYTGGHATGRLHWSEDSSGPEIGMYGGDVILQIGQEQLLFAKNKEGSIISNGQAVYVSGSSGAAGGYRSLVKLASNDDSDTLHVVGVVTETTIGVNKWGYICTSGIVRDFNTSAWAEGDVLYLGTNGNLTNVHPASDTAGVVVMGKVLRDDATEGSILVSIELHTLGNNYNGTLRQSVINKNDGASAGSSFTAINDEDYRVSLSIFGSNHSTLPNVAGIYNEGYGNTAYVTDGDKDHVFYTDPDDDHDFSALDHEVMRITADGDLLLRDSANIGAGTATDLIELDGTADFMAVNGDLGVTDTAGVGVPPSLSSVLNVGESRTASGAYTGILCQLSLSHSGLASGVQVGNKGAVSLFNTNGATYDSDIIGLQGDATVTEVAGTGGTFPAITGTKSSATYVTANGTATEVIGAEISASVTAFGTGSAINAYGLKIASTAGATNNWSIYSLGGAMAHAGNARFGSLTAPAYPLDVTGDINCSGVYRSGGTSGLTGTTTISGGVTSITVVNGIVTAVS